MSENETAPKPNLSFALLFQASLIPLALALAWLFGVDPFAAFVGGWQAWALGVVATIPMLALFIGVLKSEAEWSKRIHDRLKMVVLPLFREHPVLGTLAASVLAGVGEELLFRGVIQEAIMQAADPITGLVIASLIFGIMHWITAAYALLATGLGFYLGGLYMATGSIIVPIVAHALYDYVALRYYLLNHPPEEEVDDETPWYEEGGTKSDTEEESTPADAETSRNE